MNESIAAAFLDGVGWNGLRDGAVGGLCRCSDGEVKSSHAVGSRTREGTSPVGRGLARWTRVGRGLVGKIRTLGVTHAWAGLAEERRTLVEVCLVE